MILELSDMVCDDLIKKLDDTVDSLEAGLNCNVDTREIVREWFKSAQQSVQRTGRCHACGADEFIQIGNGQEFCKVCNAPRR